jgi:hypothetical protein
VPEERDVLDQQRGEAQDDERHEEQEAEPHSAIHAGLVKGPSDSP